MVTKLFILGLNTLILSGLLGLYALIVGSNVLLGVASSLGLSGGVFLVYSLLPREATMPSLVEYTRTLLNGLTSTLEDLDLLDANLCAVKKGGNILLVFSKAPCPLEVDPGVGFAGGSPYLAIPIAKEFTESIQEESGGWALDNVENVLRGVLVDELAACKDVRASLEGGFLRVHLIGLSQPLKEFSKYPVDPYVVYTTMALARVLPAKTIRLINRSLTLDEEVLSIGVG